MKKHLTYMHMAYDLALKGWGKVSPNPMVGAVIVKKGRVIAQGWHPYCGGPHAEAMAIKLAGEEAKGADLYVTLEPCSHYGRTPPCTQAIINSGIKNIYVGALDPNPRMNGKSMRLLQKAGLNVETGLLKEELTQLNEAFNKYITKGLPFVTGKIAQTIDGKVALLNGKSKWITGEQSRAYAHEMRYGVDAIIVGIKTILADNPFLNPTPFKPIKKVILDTHLRMPAKGNIYKDTRPEDILIFTAAKERKNLPATIILAPLKNGKIDLKWVLKYLADMEIANCLIEGGPGVIGYAFEHGLIDKMNIYIAPKIMGEGVESIKGVSSKRIDLLLHLKRITTGRIEEDVYIEGYL